MISDLGGLRRIARSRADLPDFLPSGLKGNCVPSVTLVGGSEHTPAQQDGNDDLTADVVAAVFDRNPIRFLAGAGRGDCWFAFH